MSNYVDLMIGCPACEKGSNPTFWEHTSDGQRLQINKKAIVRCKGGHAYAFKDWSWDCGNQKGEYLPADAVYVAAIMNRALKMMQGFTDDSSVDGMWLVSLCTNLGVQFGLDKD